MIVELVKRVISRDFLGIVSLHSLSHLDTFFFIYKKNVSLSTSIMKNPIKGREMRKFSY